METSSKANILIVDDNVGNLKVLGNLLRENGYRPLVAKSGKQALVFLDREIPDLILLDILMPGMDGYEVCVIIKKDPRLCEIPIIFLTAKTSTEDVVKGFEYGAVDYVVKPFKTEELLSRVSTHIELKKSKDLINEKNRQLKELNATKDKFFSIVSHDMKAPFNILIGFSKLLQSKAETFTLFEIKNIADALNRSANSGYKLLENLLDWSKSQNGMMKFVPENMHLNSFIQEIVIFFETTALQKNIKLDFISPPEVFVIADRAMLYTIIRNLVSNAFKFTNIGGKITIQIIKTENLAEISVIDTGVGISKGKMKNLFSIDTNFSTPGTANEKGSGLGLILCMEFAEKHDATILVESVLGKGSSFSFSIPIDKNAVTKTGIEKAESELFVKL